MEIKGKYLKVWKVKESNGYIKLDLGDSRKNKDGEYDNCTWFDCLLLGEASKKDIKEGDTVEITSGQIFQRKYNEKWYIDVKIWHLTVSEQEEKPEPESKPFTPPPPYNPNSGSFDDPVPF